MVASNIFTSIFVLVILLIYTNKTFSASSCPFKYFNHFGYKLSCERENGQSLDCNHHSSVKKLHIQCDNSYYDPTNVTQIIHCLDGRWSQTTFIECFPKCAVPPTKIELMPKNQKVLPTWYAEIVRKLPIQGEINIYPALIVHERAVATKCEYLKELDRTSFVIQIPNAETGHNEFKILALYKRFFEEGSIIEGLNNNDLCVAAMNFEDYIKFDENVKPICTGELPETRLNKKLLTLLPYVRDCDMPRADYKKLEVFCYDHLTGYKFKEIECLIQAPHIIKRCRIGYENTGLEGKDYINYCSLNVWYNKHKTDCKLVCGEADKEYIPPTVGLIYKGTQTNIIAAAWHVGIYANNTHLSDTFEQICGGTIIHTNIVISAAHCFYDISNGKVFDPKHYIVGAGKTFRSYETIEPFENYIRVKNINIPPVYQSHPVRYDIAILILKDHFKYTTHIKPICIDWEPYRRYDIEGGIEGRIFGWGLTSIDASSSKGLLTSTLTTLTNDECKKIVDRNHRAEISGDRFCAINYNNATACGGDSGGGFVIKKKIGSEERYYLAGIVSVGVNNEFYCSDGFKTLFTNIQYYQNIIKDLIQDHRDSIRDIILDTFNLNLLKDD